MMDDFEKAVSEKDKDISTYKLDGENAVEFLRNQKIATCTFTQGKYVSKIRKYAEQYPDECEIVADNGNCIVAHFPVKWLKISRVEPKVLTDEQKASLADRMKVMQAARQKKQETDG